MGSGTRYLQVILTTSMTVASDTRWPIETNMGFNELCVDLTACRKFVENSLQASCNVKWKRSRNPRACPQKHHRNKGGRKRSRNFIRNRLVM